MLQISNSKLCESSKCRVYSTINHPWWMSMLFHRRGLLWLSSAVCYRSQCSGFCLDEAVPVGIFVVTVKKIKIKKLYLTSRF